VIIDALPLALGTETLTGVIDVTGMPTGLSRGTATVCSSRVARA
jgi:hypothetical protein